jgi:flavin reductase (DIM6/NTAB) family NADH-FMN oxidoreductase RutF
MTAESTIAGTSQSGGSIDRAAELRWHFLDGMAKLATGVVMVTTRVEGKPWGLTVSACCSVSADPPTLLVSLANRTASSQWIRRLGCFGVSVLSTHLLSVAKFGSRPGTPKFVASYCDPESELDLAASEIKELERIPSVYGSIAHFDCEVVESVEVADHNVIFGRVHRASVTRADGALVHWDRQFRRTIPLEDSVADVIGQEFSLIESYPPW